MSMFGKIWLARGPSSLEASQKAWAVCLRVWQQERGFERSASGSRGQSKGLEGKPEGLGGQPKGLEASQKAWEVGLSI